MIRNTVIIFVLLLLVGCDSNRERTKDLDRTIVTSNSGKKYLVQHHIGENYILTPIEEKKN